MPRCPKTPSAASILDVRVGTGRESIAGTALRVLKPRSPTQTSNIEKALVVLQRNVGAGKKGDWLRAGKAKLLTCRTARCLPLFCRSTRHLLRREMPQLALSQSPFASLPGTVVPISLAFSKTRRQHRSSQPIPIDWIGGSIRRKTVAARPTQRRTRILRPIDQVVPDCSSHRQTDA